MAAPRVSVIASIGYCAFLAGPPLIGFVGEHLTVSRALLLVAGLLVLTCLVLGAVRPPAAEVSPASEPEQLEPAAETGTARP